MTHDLASRPAVAVEASGRQARAALAARPPLPALTSLRFFAALMVVLSHEVDPHGPFRHMGLVGYEAVAFFFVLSGFILTYVYGSDQPTVKLAPVTFWRARFARLAPAYYLALLIAAPRFLHAIAEGRASDQDILLAVVLTPVLLQAWWPVIEVPWNGPGWSLSCEALFYAAFPWLLTWFQRWGANTLVTVAVVSTVVTELAKAAVAPALSSLPPLQQDYAFAFFPLWHVSQFLVGMSLGVLHLRAVRVPPGWRHPCLIAALAGLGAVAGLAETLPAWTQSQPVLTGLFGLLIVGAADARNAPRVLTLRPLLLLGEASYSIYILHLPIIQSWTYAQKRMGVSLPELIDMLLVMAVITAVSLGSFLLVETPLRRLITGHREHRAA